ncbi:MAG: dipeptidase [Peptostreptococcaceae bacterium]
MKIVDLHCDTIDKLMEDSNSNLFENNYSVDIKKLKTSNSLAQVFALYFDLEKYRDNPYSRFNEMYNKFIEQVNQHSEHISLAKSYNDIIKNEHKNRISAILSIEEGGALNGKIENLNKVYDKGVRLITLTWNYENEIGYPHNSSKNLGLKPFGIEVVEKMNELGMIIDVSHINDYGFYEVSQISKKPFIASHSNSRAITNHSRNLTDDMIKVLANSGGITGINFCKFFLGNKPTSNIDDMIEHIKHIVNIGGIDVVALGTDFDGIPNGLEIENIGDIYMLEDRLSRVGFKSSEIDKIMYKNTMRVFKEVL